MDKVRAVREGLQPGTGEGQGLLVTVKADQVDIREALEQGFGVATHPQGAVNDHGTAPCGDSGFDARCQKPYASIEQYWNVAFRGGSLCVAVDIHRSPFRVGNVPHLLAETRSPSDPLLPSLAPGKWSQDVRGTGGWRSRPSHWPVFSHRSGA
ncbi:hypothetical protein GCM10009715_29330 [Paeniglutamicibacter psychrophenolicus]